MIGEELLINAIKSHSLHGYHFAHKLYIGIRDRLDEDLTFVCVFAFREFSDEHFHLRSLREKYFAFYGQEAEEARDGKYKARYK